MMTVGAVPPELTALYTRSGIPENFPTAAAIFF